MATLSISKTYSSGTVLTEQDIDNIRSGIITFINTTKLNSDNISTSIIGKLFPAGSVHIYAGSTVPDGYLFCYGQAISRATYSDLFSAISTTYGVGDGSTTFNLPDLRGRAVFGKDNMGGSAASRVTNAATSIDGTTLGSSGGSQTNTLSTTNLPAHTHSGMGSSHYHEFGHNHAILRSNVSIGSALGAYTTSSRSNADMSDFTGAQTFAEAASRYGVSGTMSTAWIYSADSGTRYSSGVLDAESGTSGADARTTGPSDSTTGSAGSDGAHNNMAPSIMLNYMIKY